MSAGATPACPCSPCPLRRRAKVDDVPRVDHAAPSQRHFRRLFVVVGPGRLSPAARARRKERSDLPLLVHRRAHSTGLLVDFFACTAVGWPSGTDCAWASATLQPTIALRRQIDPTRTAEAHPSVPHHRPSFAMCDLRHCQCCRKSRRRMRRPRLRLSCLPPPHHPAPALRFGCPRLLLGRMLMQGASLAEVQPRSTASEIASRESRMRCPYPSLQPRYYYFCPPDIGDLAGKKGKRWFQPWPGGARRFALAHRWLLLPLAAEPLASSLR